MTCCCQNDRNSFFKCQYYLDPPKKLEEALRERNLPLDSFVVFKHGETRTMNKDVNFVSESE